jgi:hypothetical protein
LDPTDDSGSSSGSVKKDNPLDQAFEDLSMSRMLRRLIFPDQEEDHSGAGFGENEELVSGVRFAGDASSSGSGDSTAFQSQDWMSDLMMSDGSDSDRSSSTSSTTSTTTTTTTTTSTTPAPTPAAAPEERDHKTWNPFTKQGFRRIFRFAF